MKNGKIVLTVMCMILLAVPVSAHNGKVALVVDNWTATVDPTDRDAARVMQSALDFYGFENDVIQYSALSSNTLTDYMAVIAVSPNTIAKAARITAYGEAGKYVMCLNDVNNTTLLDYGITNQGLVINSTATFANNSAIVNKGMLTGVTNDFEYYSYYNVTLTSPAVSNVAAKNTNHPLIIQSSHNSCNFVWVNMQVDKEANFAYQFVYNFMGMAASSTPWIMGNCPYTLDMSILMRYDDYAAITYNDLEYTKHITTYRNYYDISHECTIGAPMQGLNQSFAAFVSEADVVPHTYDHIGLTGLVESEWHEQFDLSNTVYNAIYHRSPTGLVYPGNAYNYNITKLTDDYGYTYACGALTPPVRMYGANDLDNNLWLIGYTAQNPTGDYLPSWFHKYLLNRSYVVILDHPNARIDDGSLTSALGKFSALVNESVANEGRGFLKHSEYIDRINDGGNAYVVGSNIVVQSDVSAGLSFYQPNLTNQVLIDGSTVTVLNWHNKTMLPAMRTGSHAFSYTNAYPKIIGYTNGSIIKDGFYDISSETMHFTVCDDDELYKSTSVTVTGFEGVAVLKNSSAIQETRNMSSSETFTNLVEGSYTIQKLPFTFVADANVSLNVSAWGASQKVWTESSEITNATTQHIIGGFPANTLINIHRDGVLYDEVTSDSTGQITWTYSGGYSEHTFEAFAASGIASMKTNAIGIWLDGVAFAVVVIITVLSMVIVGLLQGKKIPASSLSDLVIGLMIVSFVVTVGYGVLSAMSGII